MAPGGHLGFVHYRVIPEYNITVGQTPKSYVLTPISTL